MIYIKAHLSYHILRSAPKHGKIAAKDATTKLEKVNKLRFVFNDKNAP